MTNSAVSRCKKLVMVWLRAAETATNVVVDQRGSRMTLHTSLSFFPRFYARRDWPS